MKRWLVEKISILLVLSILNDEATGHVGLRTIRQGYIPGIDYEDEFSDETAYSDEIAYSNEIALPGEKRFRLNNHLRQPSLHHRIKTKRPYMFSYAVQDDVHGTAFSRHEVSDDRSTRGGYRVRLPDGRLQIVEYTADERGFRASVRYEDTVNLSQNIFSTKTVPKVSRNHNTFSTKTVPKVSRNHNTFSTKTVPKVSRNHNTFSTKTVPKASRNQNTIRVNKLGNIKPKLTNNFIGSRRSLEPFNYNHLLDFDQLPAHCQILENMMQRRDFHNDLFSDIRNLCRQGLRNMQNDGQSRSFLHDRESFEEEYESFQAHNKARLVVKRPIYRKDLNSYRNIRNYL